MENLGSDIKWEKISFKSDFIKQIFGNKQTESDREDGNKKNLTFNFQELLEECIWNKCSEMNLNIKNDNENKIKLFIFKSMVDLYNLYVKTIKESGMLQADKQIGNDQGILILSQNGNEIKYINLYDVAQKLKGEFQLPISLVQEQTQFRVVSAEKMEIIGNNENDADEQIRDNILQSAVNKVKQVGKIVLKKNDTRDDIPEDFKANSYINNFSVFLYFLNQMQNYLNKYDEVPKLDFTLTCAYYFFGRNQQFFCKLKKWMFLKRDVCFGQEQGQQSYEKYCVKWENIKDVIMRIRNVYPNVNFVIPYEFVLYRVIKSSEEERYSVEDLKKMTGEFIFEPGADKSQKSTKDECINELLDALANNPKKTIIFYNWPQDFIDLLAIFANLGKNKKKGIKIKDMAHEINELSDNKVIDVNQKKINYHEVFVNIFKKIRTQYSDDKSYDNNFVTESWKSEVYPAEPKILEFMSVINFDVLAVLLKKFCVTREIIEKNGSDMKLVSGIVDNLHREFVAKKDRLTNKLKNEKNTDGVELFKSELSEFIEPIKCLYGNFLYPLLLYSNDTNNKLKISSTDYTKLIEITEELTAYGLLDGSYECKLVNQAKKLEEEKINFETENMRDNCIKERYKESLGKNDSINNLLKNQNKIIENKKTHADKKIDFGNMNRFDVYEINSKLIDSTFTTMQFGPKDDEFSNLNNVFLWYKYIKSHGESSISKKLLYNCFINLQANKKTINYIWSDNNTIILAVDFVIDILGNESNKSHNNKKVAIGGHDFDFIFRLTCQYATHLSNLLNNNNAGDLQQNIEKFYELVKAAMLLYVNNYDPVDYHVTYTGCYGRNNCCTPESMFIHSFEPLFKYIGNIRDINVSTNKNNYLHCKFYLTKAINFVECTFLKKQITKRKEKKKDSESNKTEIISWSGLYDELIVFEKKRQLCAFKPNDISINDTLVYQLMPELVLDFGTLTSDYLINLLPENQSENSSKNKNETGTDDSEIRNLVERLYNEHYCKICNYNLNQDLDQMNKLQTCSLFEVALLVVGEFYKMFPFVVNSTKVYESRLKAILDVLVAKLISLLEKKDIYSICAIREPKMINSLQNMLSSYFNRLVTGNYFEYNEWYIYASGRSSMGDVNQIEIKEDDIKNIINKENNATLKNKTVNLTDFNKTLNNILEKNKDSISNHISIKTVLYKISDFVKFSEQNESKDIKNLFQIIQKLYQNDKNGEAGKNLTSSVKIRLDDAFQVIQAIFADRKITTDLIDIFTDTDLFEERSLSLDNLDKMARIIKLKADNSMPNNLSNNKRSLDSFLNMIEFRFNKEIIWTMSEYLDLVSVFYCKKINHDENVCGNFTADEINAIIKKGLELSDNWYKLCEFVKYNWNGHGVVSLSEESKLEGRKYIESANNVAILEFLKALQKPIKILRFGMININYDDYYNKLICSIQTITKNIELFSRDKKNKNIEEKLQLDVSEIIKDYVDIFDKQSYFLTSEQQKKVFGEFEKLLCTIDNNYIKKNYSLNDKNLLASQSVFNVLSNVKLITGDISHWYYILRFVGRGKLNNLDIFYLFFPAEDCKTLLDENKKYKDQSCVKNWIYEYINILAIGCLSSNNLQNLYKVMVVYNIKLDKKQFIDFLNLIRTSIDFEFFQNCLKNLLKKGIENFDDQDLSRIFSRLHPSKPIGNCRLDVLPKMLCEIRKYIENDFVSSAKDKNLIVLTIAKAIANVSVKQNMTDKIDKIKEVLRQLTDNKIKVTVKDLKNIFQYYYENNTKRFNIWTDDRNFDKSTLELLNLCVQVLSESEFKVPEVMNNKKTDVNKNINVNPYSPAITFLKNHFTNSGYSMLQMGHNEIVGLIQTVLSGNLDKRDENNKTENNKSGLRGFFANNTSKEMPTKEKTRMKESVLNLLYLFWTPVKDEKMITVDEIDPNKLIFDKNDENFNKQLAVMYFVKHLYSLLLTIKRQKIEPYEYKYISDSIQKLQQQVLEYNRQNEKGQIRSDDISTLYKKMIKDSGNNGGLPEITLKLFEDTKNGILDLITSNDENKDQDKNKKIMISFAILHAINLNQNDDNNNYDYKEIFKAVSESGVLWTSNNLNACDLKTLRFVFDQMLGRGENLNEQNKLSIPFNTKGQELFDMALGRLQDDRVTHKDLFDFLKEYFTPLGSSSQNMNKDFNIKTFFSNILKSIKLVVAGNAKTVNSNNGDYLTTEDLCLKKIEKGKDLGNKNNSQIQSEFQLSKGNIESIMGRSQDRFLYYGKETDDRVTNATNKFLTSLEINKLSSDEIAKYINRFHFESLKAFEDFMKKYWSSDKLFCQTDIQNICIACSLKINNAREKIEFRTTKLFFMNAIKNRKYEDNGGKKILVHLANKMKILKRKSIGIDENLSSLKIKNDVLEYCQLEKYDENDEQPKKQREETEKFIELLFGLEKEYEKCIYGLLISLLFAVIFLILICNSFNSYLLIAFLIASALLVCFSKSLWDKRKFNKEQECLQKLSAGFKPENLYTIDRALPEQGQVETYYLNNNDQQSMIPLRQPYENIINTAYSPEQ